MGGSLLLLIAIAPPLYAGRCSRTWYDLRYADLTEAILSRIANLVSQLSWRWLKRCCSKTSLSISRRSRGSSLTRYESGWNWAQTRQLERYSANRFWFLWLSCQRSLLYRRSRVNLPTQAVAQSQWSLEYPNLANCYLNEKFFKICWIYKSFNC
jgi:hypothetical protein